MEKLLDQLNKEFQILNKDCFISLFSLLLFITKNSTSKITVNLLNKKISNYQELNDIKCRYFSLGFIIGDKRNIDILNSNITLCYLLKNIDKAFDKDIKIGKIIGPTLKISSIIENEQKDWFMISLKSEDIYQLITVILKEFNFILEKLNALELKCEQLNLSKFNSTTNIVKGYSYDYSIKNFYITEDNKEVIEIEITSEYARDTVSQTYYKIEFEKLLYIYNNCDEQDFKNLIKENCIKKN